MEVNLMNKQFYMGCSGFYYNHWKNLFYPPKIAKTKWLQYYSQHFNTVEVNSTFYRYPKESMIKGWYNKTPKTFRFVLKANRAITHTRKFHDTREYIARFYELAKNLGEKLSCVLFQLPPFLHKDLKLLENIASQVDTEILNVLEFRHSSWWDNQVYSIMKKQGLVFCSVSAFDLPEDLVVTSGVVYVRFHGKNGWYAHFYPDSELEGWAEKIKNANAKQIHCYFNNDYNANAVANCQTLKKLLE